MPFWHCLWPAYLVCLELIMFLTPPILHFIVTVSLWVYPGRWQNSTLNYPTVTFCHILSISLLTVITHVHVWCLGSLLYSWHMLIVPSFIQYLMEIGYIGNSSLTFWNKLWIPHIYWGLHSSEVKQSKDSLSHVDGTNRLSWNVGNQVPTSIT